MTGEPPQPGETPRDQGNPWTHDDTDTAWWRGEPDPAPAGNDHAAEGSRLATARELMIIEPEGDGASRVPEENADRNRPTVALAPHRPPAISPAAEARLENSTFWLSEEERAARAAAQAARPGNRPRPALRNPATALLALLALGLTAAFFGWVSAEPFWLAVGHGDKGYATTARCHGSGLSQRCIGRFTSDEERFSVSRVTLLGVSGDARRPGAVSPARMVSPTSAQAYIGPAGALMHLRWTLGFLLVLICGYGIAEATGARRLESRRARRRAVLACVAGPLLLLAGFLIAAF